MGRAVDCEGMTDRERMAKREGTAECERTASHEGMAVREWPAQGGETALRERIFRAVEALEQPMITSIRAVSYTHLDVYKRQFRSCPRTLASTTFCPWPRM